MNQPTLQHEDTTSGQKLFVALELSGKSWTLLFGNGQRVREISVDVGDIDAILTEAGKARLKFGLPDNCEIVSCQEAGRDGFWVHRALEAKGIKSLVVDSASIEVDRRMRRAKTDKLDARKLLQQLIRHHRGDELMRTVNVPSSEMEDARRDGREMERLKKERTGHLARIKGLLVLHGVSQFKLSALEKLTDWEGKALPSAALAELVRERERLELVQKQLKTLVQQRDELLEQEKPSPLAQKVAMLIRLKGVAETSSWLFVQEFFGWRKFRNRRQVGSAAGLTCSPYDSGFSEREQGISKAGNRRVRVMAVQIAWCWLRYQRQSALSQWFLKRFGEGKRSRRVGIVALARRVLIALWRYLDQGVVPDGAVLKTT